MDFQGIVVDYGVKGSELTNCKLLHTGVHIFRIIPGIMVWENVSFPQKMTVQK